MTEIDEVTIRLHIERLKEGGYVATSPDVPGLVAEGRSVTETVEIAQGRATWRRARCAQSSAKPASTSKT